MYKPNPTVIKGGTGTGNIQQARRSHLGRSKRSKSGKASIKHRKDVLRAIGAL